MDNRQRFPPPTRPQPKATRKRRGGGDESLKVVYISSPMKVRTSAARFRALVQELTGKNSDIGPYMDAGGGALADYRDEDGTLLPDTSASAASNSDEMTTSTTTAAATSDPALMGGVDNVFAPQFGGIFSFCDTSFETDHVLGSYQDLIM